MDVFDCQDKIGDKAKKLRPKILIPLALVYMGQKQLYGCYLQYYM